MLINLKTLNPACSAASLEITECNAVKNDGAKWLRQIMHLNGFAALNMQIMQSASN